MNTTQPTAATAADIAKWKTQIPDWKVEPSQIAREFKFKDYYQTIAFVNAIAWIAHGEDHHPGLTVSYNRCVVQFSTHSVGGLSEKDLVCAMKVDRLIAE